MNKRMVNARDRRNIELLHGWKLKIEALEDQLHRAERAGDYTEAAFLTLEIEEAKQYQHDEKLMIEWGDALESEGL